MKPFPKDKNARQAELTRRIESGDPEAIALALIRELNQDNDCRYAYSQGQLATLTEAVKETQAQGVVWTEQLTVDVATGAQGAVLYGEISDVLDQIFEGEDGNGERLKQPDQPFHFDSFPIY